MATAKNLTELSKIIKGMTKTVMVHEVADAIRTIEQHVIDREVYDAYNNSANGYKEPYRYDRRRDNDGLRDRENMESSIIESGNTISMSIENMAKGAMDSGLLIAPLIEYGDKAGYGEYDYKTNRDEPDTAWQYLQPRPFTEKTTEMVNTGNYHVNAMKKGLTSLGLTVK